MDTLFVEVLLDNGQRAEYVIVGTMPVVEFCRAVVARHNCGVSKVNFLNEPTQRPAVAEVLPALESAHG